MATKAAAKTSSGSKGRSGGKRAAAVRKSVGGGRAAKSARRSTGKSRASVPSLLSAQGMSKLGTKTVKVAKDLVAKGAELIVDIMPGKSAKGGNRRGSKKR